MFVFLSELCTWRGPTERSVRDPWQNGLPRSHLGSIAPNLPRREQGLGWALRSRAKRMQRGACWSSVFGNALLGVNQRGCIDFRRTTVIYTACGFGPLPFPGTAHPRCQEPGTVPGISSIPTAHADPPAALPGLLEWLWTALQGDPWILAANSPCWVPERVLWVMLAEPPRPPQPCASWASAPLLRGGKGLGSHGQNRIALLFHSKTFTKLLHTSLIRLDASRRAGKARQRFGW